MAIALDPKSLKTYIDEILGPENKERKKDHLTRQEVYRERQKQFILERLRKEFDAKTVAQMRTITSVNLTKRIVTELAAVYKEPPQREYTNATEAEKAAIKTLYDSMKVDVKLKKMNRYFKLHGQATAWIMPRAGKLEMRILAPHQYDVIPDPENPEAAGAYVISVLDKSQLIGDCRADGVNQKIADPDDYKKDLMRFLFWTPEASFVTNAEGYIVGEAFPNPIGRLPFVDISEEKDYEYWVRSGSAIVDFSIDFGVLLSDTANINRLQGYSQAIIYAEDMPEEIIVGPNRIIRIPLKADSSVQPKFEFATPNPDMASSLELLETFLRLFLSSRGIDTKAVSGKNQADRFSSGVERLLAMIEKFDASRDDFDSFMCVESEVFDISRAWNNALQSTKLLGKELQNGKLSENIDSQCKFSSPEIVQTISEREDSAIKQLEAGLMSRVEAVAYIRQVDKEKAEEIVEEIDEEEGLTNGGPDQPNDKEEQGSTEGQPAGATGGGGSGQPGAQASGGAGDSRQDNQADGSRA